MATTPKTDLAAAQPAPSPPDASGLGASAQPSPQPSPEGRASELRSSYAREEPGGDVWVLNLGPQHPATHTTLRHVLELDGERVLSCVVHIGYRVVVVPRCLPLPLPGWIL